MAIEKDMYTTPIMGMDVGEEMLDEGGMPEMDLEIEIVNPESVTLDDGSMEITLIPDMMADLLEAGEFGDNLAEFMEEDDLRGLGSELIEEIENDINSRRDWVKNYVEGLKIIGMEYEERTEPWDGACGVHSPILAEAAIRFQAETMSETFPAAGPVKTKILGDETPEKQEAAERVRGDMNYQLTEKMVEYRSEHERMLYTLGLAGSAFKKIYFDPNIGRQVAPYVPAEDVIVPYGASNIETAERVTHIMRKTRNEMMKLQASGFYLDVELQEPEVFHSDIEEAKAEQEGYEVNDDDRYCLYEVHADLIVEGIPDSEEDGLPRPYVVTIERQSGDILSIRRNWEEGDELTQKRQYFVHYVYVPGFGFYGLGLVNIVGGYARAGTSIIRQLVDAGTLSNLQGGFKSRGMRVKNDDTPIQPGEWKDVDVPSGSIRDNLLPLPYKEPSQTLFQLLNTITTEGRRLGAISDMNISDMSANAPVGTTLAILERVLKPMAAVQARVHYAMKLEFKLLRKIIAENAPQEYEYDVARGEIGAKAEDYALVEVIPVSDPNSTTMAQRVAQYQTAMQLAAQTPEIYDLPYLHRQMLEVLGIKNSDKIVPMKDDMKPKDPVSENMDALTGVPIKAFIYQDQEAHIATHTAMIQDPAMMQMIGQTPGGQKVMAAMQAHIAEHLAFSYRNKIQEKLGVPLPPPGEELPKDIEVELSKVMAMAAQQNTQQNQQQAAQAQAQEQAQDPIMQMKQQELQIKGQEQQRKAQKDQAEMQLKGQEQQRKTIKDQMDLQIDQAQLQLEKQQLDMDAERNGSRMSADRRNAGNKIDLELAKLLQQAKLAKHNPPKGGSGEK
tara:strand:+ start:3585 stop:6104 length:2520 start_codon:yes stop_codon:yes gene_type:complete